MHRKGQPREVRERRERRDRRLRLLRLLRPLPEAAGVTAAKIPERAMSFSLGLGRTRLPGAESTVTRLHRRRMS